MRLAAFAAVLALAMAGRALAALGDGPPSPLDPYFERPTLSHGALSPSGRLVALVQKVGDGEALTVTDIAARTTRPIIPIADPDTHIAWIDWKSETRLIVGISLRKIKHIDSHNIHSTVRSWVTASYIIAVDADGGHPQQLPKNSEWNGRFTAVHAELLDRLSGDPDHVLIMGPEITGYAAAFRVDVNTGEAERIEIGDRDTSFWMVDQQGRLVVRIEDNDWSNSRFIQVRANGEGPWSTIATMRRKDFEALFDFEFLEPAPQAGQFYVTVRPTQESDGEGRRLRLYDTTLKSLLPPIWPDTVFDIDAILTDPATRELRAVCYWRDIYGCDFKDPTAKAAFAGLAKFFGSERSVRVTSLSQDGQRWLLDVSAPTEPGAYYLFDRATSHVEPLGLRYGAISHTRLGPMKRINWRARDGTEVSGYLTRPPGAPAGPLPLVVLPHGGPEARDFLTYNRWTQVLAGAGYMVLQPNFRGSGGLGRSWAVAGHRQWGERMQQDVIDGVNALVADGTADRSRMCIFGASYGGYVALTAGGQNPDLFKCVISWAGVSDLEMILKQESSTEVKRKGPAYKWWIERIGDPATDIDRLRAASPVRMADRFLAPVLLIHGEEDTTVRPEQSRAMASALKHAGREVRLLMVPDEFHGGWYPQDEKLALTEVLTFIRAHITPAMLSP